ncbi:MAG TPA: rhamnulokinase family protein [Kineosporiaceae bacterium]|nr:rhamnulokinase family protein [Kineosporiaceae bacterium]
MSSGVVAAVDLGATSGRVVLGRVGPGRLEIEDVHRFPNVPVRTRDGLHWNILELYRNVLEGLRKAVAAEPDLVSIGIDSWAVDYALLRGDRVVSTPFHYRDERTARGVEAVGQVIEAAELYAANGLQFLPFNTLYQLAVDRDEGLLDASTSLLLVPDLIAYWLTGVRQAELTNASTTGLLDVSARTWHGPLGSRLGLPAGLLPQLTAPGERIGTLTPDVAAELGTRPLDVVAVGSHDTASAVVAVPMTSRNAAYICSGTWSLIGVETDQPILSEESRQANFTNEGGVDGRIRYLRNVMGMWLVNECVDAWRKAGSEVDLPGLVDAAADVPEHVVFDVGHPSLLPAGDMPSRIIALAPDLRDADHAVVIRSILESLALAYAQTLDELQRLTGVSIDTVHIVGGASQNALLCRLIADRSGRDVVAGPVEATAIGNIMVQARAAGLVSGTLEDLRALVARTTRPVVHTAGARP